MALVVMEACGSAHHWARWLQTLGIQVRLLPPRYVRAYVRRNKTDAADAAALLEAARCADLHPVRVKSIEQQALQALHRTRSLWQADRTRRINTLRGYCREFGIAIAQGARLGLEQISRVLAEPHTGLPDMLRPTMRLIVEEVRLLEAYKVFNALGDPDFWLAGGTVTSTVVKAVDGTYDFYWRIQSTGVFRVGEMNFDRTFGDVGAHNYRTDLEPGTAPTFVGVSGAPIGFSFLDIESLLDGHGSSVLETPGQSAALFVDTDATAYSRNTHFTLRSLGGLGFRATGNSDPYETFGPATCPAPGSLARRLFG